jgi:pimeloyl-ACP methyl ester carboxylesterase
MFRNLVAVIAASRIVRMDLPIQGDIPVLQVNNSGRYVIRLPLNADTAMNGVQSMFFDDRKGHLLVQPLSRTESSHRDFEVIKFFSEPPKVGSKVWLSGWLGEQPEDFGITEYQEVSMSNGARAWAIAGGDHWVISVHGRKATRAETLRVAPTIKRLGFSNLVLSHETDPTPVGLGTKRSNLGATEWRQISSAVEYARSQGAKSISLYGWSLGCLFIGQYLKNTQHRTDIARVIFDSPLLDFPSTIRLQSMTAGFNEKFGDLVLSKLKGSLILKLLGLTREQIPDLIFDLKQPTMVLYSQLDGYVSMNRIDEFLALNQLGSLEHFVGARHCRLFNQDPERYEAAIRNFLQPPT